MSSWGNLDNVTLTGTVTVAVANGAAVLGTATAFSTELKPGDYITIASNKYQIASIASNTALTLTSAAATTSVGVKAFAQQGPKYIANVTFPANNYSIQNIYGIDRNEITVDENKDRGVASHTGWIHYTTYTDALNQTRNKSEVLVAMSKNFAANSTSVLFGAGAGQDANDDTVAADYTLLFTAQPANVTDYLANLGSASFQVAATSDPVGATITYQWYENNTTHIYALTNAGVYSNTTTNTLSLSNVSGKNGYSYFVIIGGDGGADSNTSGNATITII